MTTARPSESTTSNGERGVPDWGRSVAAGLLVYGATLVPVFLGVLAGFRSATPGREIPYGRDSLLLRFAAWDGGQFMQIMDAGYQYDPDRISNIVVFPGYPLLGLGVQMCTGLSSAASLLVVSHLCLIAALMLYHRLIGIRFGGVVCADVSLAALALLPPTFFWRMAYSEAPFVLLEVMFLYGVRRNWGFPCLALIVGVSTGFRLVGVAMIIPLAMEWFSRQGFGVRSLYRGSLLLPLSLSGVLAFMAFQWIRLGDPILFVRGQDSFYLRMPVSSVEHWYRLVTLEPILGNYLAGSSSYWRLHSPTPNVLFNLQFWNPVWFCFAVVLVCYGWFRRILTDPESALGFALLLIPYLGRAEEFCMGSQARYASVALPAMMVLGILLHRVPRWCRVCAAIIAAGLLAAYSAYFAAWYFFL
ncbi:MAG: hypothetical protein KDA96_14160 [Planctomycetaceae bacterium]|nr:hypothetical protein [Planctomycetaceae bacterium]